MVIMYFGIYMIMSTYILVGYYYKLYLVED